MVDQRRGEAWLKPQPRRAPVGAAPVGPALIADFLKIGVHQAETGRVAHVT